MTSNPKADLIRAMPRLDREHLQGLSDEELRDLSELLAATRVSQTKALNDAIEKAMRHVPLLLRGPLKKILFP